MFNFIAINIPKEYRFDPFQKDYIIHPFSKELTKKQQWFCFAISAVIAAFTLGIFHLIISRKSFKEAPFVKVELKGRAVHIRPKTAWKSVPACGNIPDFSYVKPKTDLSSIIYQPEEMKDKVEEQSLSQMREAMKAMDSAIVDAALEVIENPNHPEFLNIVNTFSTRILDLYQAYVAVHIDRETPSVPYNVGLMKACGLSHNELFSFAPPCLWYKEHGDQLRANLLEHGLTVDEVFAIIAYIASHQYKWDYSALEEIKNPTVLESTTKEIIQKHINKLKSINLNCASYCKDLKNNIQQLSKIKQLDVKLNSMQNLSQLQKESCKQDLADFAKQENFCVKDHHLRLLQELHHRFDWREHEPGHVGSPLRLLNILEGKHDKETPDQHFRSKLFFCYGSKGIVNEIAGSPQMIERINAKLKDQQKDWQIDEQLASLLAKSWGPPVYRLGVYANENNLGFRTRHFLSSDEIKENHIKDPNLTYSEAERIACKVNASSSDLRKRFRMKLKSSEEMAIFGTNANLEAREMERRLQIKFPKKPSSDSSKREISADTHFFESNLDYHKKTQRIRWTSGKHAFELHDKKTCKSPYLDYVEDLGLPQYSGISGSTDHTLTMAGIVGIRAKEDLMLLRFCYLPWMVGHEDHTVDEILIAAKTFGLSYTPSPDYYKQIYPGLDSFLESLEKAQKARGYMLPDQYLSSARVSLMYQASSTEE